MRIVLGVLAAVLLWIGVVFTLVGEVDTTPNFSFGFITSQWTSLKNSMGLPASPVRHEPDAPDCPGESDEHREAAGNQKVLIGMSPCLVRVALGEPDRESNNPDSSGSPEQWVYDQRTILFENDLVVSIQDAGKP